jgi:hypothetical protein
MPQAVAAVAQIFATGAWLFLRLQMAMPEETRNSPRSLQTVEREAKVRKRPQARRARMARVAEQVAAILTIPAVVQEEERVESHQILSAITAAQAEAGEVRARHTQAAHSVQDLPSR